MNYFYNVKPVIWIVYLLSILIVVNLELVKSNKNVLLIVADDLGWSDLGILDPRIITPNINFLMKNGILLNQSYTYSLCTPSRNSILTGVYAEHTGLQHYVILPEQPIGLPLNFKTLPKYFKENGYNTHMVGKWHLGMCNISYTPSRRGFDTFFGYLNAEEDYLTHKLQAGAPDFKNEFGLDYWFQNETNLTPLYEKDGIFSMYSYTERTLKILDDQKNRDEPFFIYFASQSPHAPNNVPKEYEDKYQWVEDPIRRKYLASITSLDESIGHIMDKLKKLNLLDQTLIFFTSDNGGSIFDGGRNYPLRGAKFTAFDGGHRVRSFIYHSDLKPYVYNGMFHSIDWVPTILNAAISEKIQLDDIDGINQWDSISRNLIGKRTSFIYNIDPYGQLDCKTKTEAIRSGDWKMIVGCPGPFDDWYPIPKHDGDSNLESISKSNKSNQQNDFKVFLFNLKNDPLEKENLIDQRPDIALIMHNKLTELRKFVVDPLNPPSMQPSPSSNPKLWNGTWSPGWCDAII